MKWHPEDIAERLKRVFGEDIHGTRIIERPQGVSNSVMQKVLWVTMARRVFHRSILLIKNEFSHPHISCPMASKEHDDGMELIYPFILFSGEGNFREVPVIITVFIPFTDLRIRSITDVVPGILYMEREAKEMLGIMFEDIPDDRRLFTPHYLKDKTPMRNSFEDPSLSKTREKGGRQ